MDEYWKATLVGRGNQSGNRKSWIHWSK